MVIYARVWHTGSCLCIRKGPLELLIPAETHNMISSIFVQKNSQTWSLSPPCTCTCRVGDPSHQTLRARDKCGSPFPDSRNQTPCSCMCTGRSSLAPFRLEGQLYFSKPFTNVSHEKIDPGNPWTAGKENITCWSLCASVCSKQPPPAKSHLPCSSQKTVIWTLKMVAGLFLPSNNHSSSCHCSENLLF